MSKKKQNNFSSKLNKQKEENENLRQQINKLNAFIDRAFKDFSKMNKQKKIYNPL